MKIGILGGTFNPIHNGHISMAEKAYRELSLNKVVFMPSGSPPHKNGILDAVHRCRMTELAIEKYDYFELSGLELDREGNSYTAETLRILHEADPDSIYVFIMGADSFFDINEWYHPERIFRYADIAVCARDDVRERKLFLQRSLLIKNYNARISILDFEKVHISSKQIREIINTSGDYKSVSGMVDEKVLEYIKENKLYL